MGKAERKRASAHAHLAVTEPLYPAVFIANRASHVEGHVRFAVSSSSRLSVLIMA